jgi:DNA polymerase V
VNPDYFALVDCNNFYASCEQVFQPGLRDCPVVVLGNNDGCVVARSRQARALGIRLGDPYFRIRPDFEARGGVAFSSNYALYGDMSRRVMETLREFTEEVEVYSIDEAFLGLRDAARCLPALGRQIGRTVARWTGLPVSVGLGRTKTLAKLASRVAKNGEGVCSLVDHPQLRAVLEEVPVEEVWGIGPKYRSLLQSYRVANAFQLSQVDERWARRRLTVMGQRTVLELRGIRCFRLHEAPPARKTIARGRGFGRPVAALEELEEALASYVAAAARQLRQQRLAAGAMQVTLETDRFGARPWARSVFRPLPWPTAASGELIRWAGEALAQLYRPGAEYRRCGVVLVELSPADALQSSLFSGQFYDRKKRAVMEVVDQVTAQWGAGALRFAREGFSQGWGMRQGRRSPRYTTRWDELPVAET